MKSRLRTILALGMCWIELSSMFSTFAPAAYAPCPLGRTTRPWSMSGTRTCWMYTHVSFTLSAMSTRGTRVPTIVY